MKFKIIPNEQTPEATEEIVFPDDMLLINKFYSFARKRKNCAGLASTQVSVDGERIMKPFFVIKDVNIWKIYINPTIVHLHGKPIKKIEGCLTWIGKKIIVDRFPKIDVKYFNTNGILVNETISGFKAQVFQHEYDHLLGIKEKFYDHTNAS